MKSSNFSGLNQQDLRTIQADYCEGQSCEERLAREGWKDLRSVGIAQKCPTEGLGETHQKQENPVWRNFYSYYFY